MRWIGKSGDGETVTLRKFDGGFQTGPMPDDASSLRRGAVLDVETTGLDFKSDVVIEIALKTFNFDAESGQVVQVGPQYMGLDDPGRPLSPEIIELTGLTDDDLRGQSIDWAEVRRLIDAVDIVIAHNAAFDRTFVDPHIGAPRKIWGCSQRLIDWQGHGFSSAKLELLNIYHGFFVDSHRALTDVNATLHLMTFCGPQSDRPYLAELLENARKPTFRVWATGAPFETKDALKRRRYRWNADRRTWVLSCGPGDVEAEKTWLAENVYQGRGGPKVDKVSPYDAYKREP